MVGQWTGRERDVRRGLWDIFVAWWEKWVEFKGHTEVRHNTPPFWGI